MLAAHPRDRAERAQPVAAFGDLEEREVPRRDPQPGRVGQRVRRRRVEHGPLLSKSAQQPVGDLRNFLATEDADQVVDPGPSFEQRFTLPLGQAAGHDDAAQLAALFELQHLVDRGERFLPCGLDEAAGVDHGKIGTARVS